MKFTKRRGILRLYDGTGTPFYLRIKFDGDTAFPLGVPSTEEVLVMDRGVMTADAHYIQGGDDKVMEPGEFTFSTIVEDTTITTYLLAWLRGETVNSHTIVTTKGTTARVGAITNPGFADTSKKAFNCEILWDASSAGTDLGYKVTEVYFDLAEQKIQEGDDGVTLSLNGKIYGSITAIAAFTAGTDVTA
jgi:hypothetical protein